MNSSTLNLLSPWQHAFVGNAAGYAYRLTRHQGMKDLCLMSANMSAGLVNHGGLYTSAYRLQATPRTTAFNFTSNGFVPIGNAGIANNTAGLTAGSADITMVQQTSEGYPPAFTLPLTVGDIVRFYGQIDSGASVAVPAEVVEGQDYHVTSISQHGGGPGHDNNQLHDVFQVSATANGSPITFGATAQAGLLLVEIATAKGTPATSALFVPNGDCYAFYHRGALIWASFLGSTTAPAALAKMNAFCANADLSSYMSSAFKVPA